MIVDLIRCPLDGCGWKHLRTVNPPPPETLARVFGAGAVRTATINRALQDAEDALAEHMDGHTVVEFLTTITRLRRELQAEPDTPPMSASPDRCRPSCRNCEATERLGQVAALLDDSGLEDDVADHARELAARAGKRDPTGDAIARVLVPEAPR